MDYILYLLNIIVNKNYAVGLYEKFTMTTKM